MVPRVKSKSFVSMIATVPGSLADEAAGILAGLGALGCEIRKLGKPSPSGKAALVHAYFEHLDTATRRAIERMLTIAGMLADGAPIVVKRITDPGWATMWQRRFEPFRVGKRLLIVPPWKRERAVGREQIVIQPGQAFGTGHHGSTHGTLTIIEELFGDRRFERVLDVGTGSGILAIAMRKLGAAKVVAIDLDAVALDNAAENGRHNSLEHSIRFSIAPVASIRGRFDLITANILSSILIAMAPQLKRRLRAEGALVLAGILAREVASVAAAYAPDLKLQRVRADGPWRALLLAR
jgi:ribosomal protein L11 methyltransferase